MCGFVGRRVWRSGCCSVLGSWLPRELMCLSSTIRLCPVCQRPVLLKMLAWDCGLPVLIRSRRPAATCEQLRNVPSRFSYTLTPGVKRVGLGKASHWCLVQSSCCLQAFHCHVPRHVSKNPVLHHVLLRFCPPPRRQKDRGYFFQQANHHRPFGVCWGDGGRLGCHRDGSSLPARASLRPLADTWKISTGSAGSCTSSPSPGPYSSFSEYFFI